MTPRCHHAGPASCPPPSLPCVMAPPASPPPASAKTAVPGICGSSFVRWIRWMWTAAIDEQMPYRPSTFRQLWQHLLAKDFDEALLLLAMDAVQVDLLEPHLHVAGQPLQVLLD